MPSFVVDLERLKYLHCGLGQFSLHFGQALLSECSGECSGEWTPVFLLPPGGASHFPRQPNTLTANLWRREVIHRWVRPISRYWARTPSHDVWHVTHQDSRYWPLNANIPVILTIHDLNFLRTKSAGVIQRRIRGLQHKINRAAILATGSEHAAGEIREHFSVGEKVLQVIPNGVCLDSDTIPSRPAAVPANRPYLFTIGDIRPSKNFHVLIQMLRHLPEFTLVIAGSKKDAYATAIEQQAAEAGVAHRLMMPGRVTEAERLWLYQNCEALVFPSLAEGFGLPLIEAMYCGRPVFSSRCTSLPEVGGSLAYYWDTFADQHMAEVVRRGLAHFAANPHQANCLREWSQQFSWQRVAQRYLSLYREVLSRQVLMSRSAA